MDYKIEKDCGLRLNGMEEAWRELRYAVRTLSDIHECDYNTLYTAVRQAVSNIVDTDKATGAAL